MIDLLDRSHCPSLAELDEYVGNPLFNEIFAYMDSDYQALINIEYSGDKVLLGWNVKFKKAGRTLCTIYPRRGSFGMLLVVDPKEKPRVEALLPTFSPEFQSAYLGTQEGMGQRWMILSFDAHTPMFDDAMAVVRLRRQTR